MDTSERDTGDLSDAGERRNGESLWDIIDRERAIHPPPPLPADFFEPISQEGLERLGMQIAKHDEFMAWFAPYLEKRRSEKGLGQADG
jgi:hypothetical protein